MAWLAVDKDGTENIYYLKPERKKSIGTQKKISLYVIEI